MKQTLLFDKINSLKIWWWVSRYKKCPKCGSNELGIGKGAFEVNEYHFKRTCKCGLNITRGRLYLTEKPYNK
ncbi:DUF3797 domain-containing protein [Ornithinibacillus sp. L9]|uniref:DUF3797 domain-containing protein n=1 Tax=Ornithinibacillus caprae TaxID=2678566 RepID=A0A6N8FLX9_9BACI|nr:DUF3797 domain-containing protein [Ornithinibacillus caprae]MUK90171.1 DUF3797 domain-containing protein [Ornithinibacillus caprae]